MRAHVAPLIVFSVVQSNDEVEHYFFTKAEFEHYDDGSVRVAATPEYTLVRPSPQVPISDALLNFISHLGTSNSELKKDRDRYVVQMNSHADTITQQTEAYQKLQKKCEKLEEENKHMKLNIKLSYDAYFGSSEKN